MHVYNYIRTLGAFINSAQVIDLPAAPVDRGEKKMLAEAQRMWESAWDRKQARLREQMAKGEDVDMVAENEQSVPRVRDGRIQVPLQFLQDYLIRRIAAVPAQASIHTRQAVADLKEVFAEYGVHTRSIFEALTFEGFGWQEREGQKPKLLVFARETLSDGEVVPVCVRFEATMELAQKFLYAAQELALQPGQAFGMRFSAVDPAIERNRKAGKEVAPVGKYVNHEITVQKANAEHHGKPPAGVRFQQKMSEQEMRNLYQIARAKLIPAVTT